MTKCPYMVTISTAAAIFEVILGAVEQNTEQKKTHIF